ncbi:MAG TPA: beta-propeller domain-containing protein [Burkholderiales bacterium]|nr:beta-propeller domain-containing protein [Burkholderiales bacterium]
MIQCGLKVAAWAACATLLLAGCVSQNSSAAPRATLQAFNSEQEIRDLFKGWAEEQQRRMTAERKRREEARAQAGSSMQFEVAPQSAPMAKMAAPATAGSVASDSVTNVQTAGVDEGGIVKLHGEHLVILRRGRLFTVNVSDRDRHHAVKPVSVVDAYGEGIDPRGAWYDEMLISGNTIVVIGYSYQRGGTEIGLFDIAGDGRLKYKSTYHLRSNDYYSSRNYASRLIGNKLIFYTPLQMNPFAADPFAAFPAMRRWRSGVTPADFKPIAPATRIYRTDEPLDPYQGIALHTVSVCDLAQPELDCESTAVMGAPGRVFYVSAGSVYVWTTAGRRAAAGSTNNAAVFRIPLDGSAPSALKAAGAPIDQFSFLEGDDGHLNVLLRANARGDGMWAAEVNGGDMALLRVPLASFSNGRDAAPAAAYRALPKPESGALQSRYIGPYLLYGAGAGWSRAPRTLNSNVYAVRYADGTAAQTVPLAHAVDRIEALGANAVVVGSDGQDLHFTSLRLDAQATPTDRYTRRDAAQGETRSHGFFYKPDNQTEGMVGLPVVGAGRPGAGQLRSPSAAVLFLKNRSLRLSEIGALDSTQGTGTGDDGCRASCVDWYGNSRPLFIGGRVFALMGYELVEGRLAGGRISEVQRVNYAPGMAMAR